MNKETIKYPSFSEFNFITLYCAINFKNGCSPVIEHRELEKRLYKYYRNPEFEDLFQDIVSKKDYMNPEESSLNLSSAISKAQLFGFLTPIYGVGETKSIISCDNQLAEQIILNADKEMVEKMNQLFNEMFNLDNNPSKDDFQETQKNETAIIKKKSL